jgi:hypothetical protein
MEKNFDKSLDQQFTFFIWMDASRSFRHRRIQLANSVAILSPKSANWRAVWIAVEADLNEDICCFCLSNPVHPKTGLHQVRADDQVPQRDSNSMKRNSGKELNTVQAP